MLDNKRQIEFFLNGCSLSLQLSEQVFVPTLVTKVLAEALVIEPNTEILDLGCGVCPLGIFAAKKGAQSVTCIDIMSEACTLALNNASLNGVGEKVEVIRSDLFEAIKGRQFDLIIDDVSGIAEEIARISSWYPEPIPTGGIDGTVTVLRMLDEVKEYLKPGGKLYLPVASLSCLPRIVQRARKLFGSNLELIVDRMIPFSPELYGSREKLERLRKEGIIDFSQKNSRCLWNLKVFVGTKA